MDAFPESFPLHVRVRLLCFAWLGVLLVMLSQRDIGYVFSITGILMFPMGLDVLVEFPLSRNGTGLSIFGGWLLYAVLMGLALKVQRRVSFLVIFSLFCLVLATNVVGCLAIRPSW